MPSLDDGNNLSRQSKYLKRMLIDIELCWKPCLPSGKLRRCGIWRGTITCIVTVSRLAFTHQIYSCFGLLLNTKTLELHAKVEFYLLWQSRAHITSKAHPCSTELNSFSVPSEISSSQRFRAVERLKLSLRLWCTGP